MASRRVPAFILMLAVGFALIGCSDSQGGRNQPDPTVTERLLASAPDIERRTIDAYHWPLTERPEQVRTAIEDWFAHRMS